MGRLHEKGDAHSVVLIVMVLTLIIGLGWVFINSFMNKSSVNNPTQSTLQKEIQASSPRELLMNALQFAEILDGEPSSDSMILRRFMPEYGFSVPSTTKNTVTSMVHLPESEYDARTTSLKKYFTDRNYSVVENGRSGAGKSTNYDGEKFSCEYNDWGMSNEARGTFRSLLVSCSSIQDFENSGKELKPLYDLLAADTSNDKKDIRMKPLDIKPSKTNGYNVFKKGAAIMSTAKQSTPYVSFYQTPDNSWHFIYTGIGGFKCADVNTPQAIAAFAGEKCFEADGRTSRTL